MTDHHQKALVAAKTAIREVMANFPPDVWWVYVKDAVSTHLAEADVDHDLPDEADDDRPGVVALFGDYLIEWDGETEAGVGVIPRQD